MVSAHPQQDISVLVVSNDVTLNGNLCEQLQTKGYHPYGLRTISTALKYLSTQPAPALVVIDFELPDGNGRALLEFLKNSSFSKTSVVALIDRDSTQPNHPRIDLILLKPLHIQKMLSLATELLASR